MLPRAPAAALLALAPLVGGVVLESLGAGVFLVVAGGALTVALLTSYHAVPAGPLRHALGFAALWPLVGCALGVVAWTLLVYPVTDPEWAMILLVLPLYWGAAFAGAVAGFALRRPLLGRAV